MNEPRDDQIERLYRNASDEMPGAASDAAILAMARRAAVQPAARPPALRRWRAPLALAASLVLAVGIVSRVQLEQDAGTAPAMGPANVPTPAPSAVPPAAPAAPLASVPAALPTSPATREEPKAGALSGEASAPSTASASRQDRPASPSSVSERRASGAAGSDGSESAAKKIMAAPFPAQAGGEADRASDVSRPASSGMRKEQLADRDSAAASAPAPAPAAEAAGSAARTLSGSGGAELSMAKPSADTATSAQGTARQADRARAAAAPMRNVVPAVAPLTAESEAGLSAEEWLRRIIEVRRAGRHDEADASLKRFAARYPETRVPPAALRNPE